ncbi:hypothetical protein [Rossellomorea sp. LjRoot5]
MDQQKRNVSKAETDIDEVKRRNAQSGLTYNQVKQLLGKQYTDKK